MSISLPPVADSAEPYLDAAQRQARPPDNACPAACAWSIPSVIPVFGVCWLGRR